jgi:hypothetical protein
MNIGRLVMNVLTGLILLATLCLGTGYVYTFINPQASFNPYPPPTLPPTLGPPTPTNTPAIYLPTEIPPSATPRPLPTAIPTATITPNVTATPTATLELTPPVTAQPGAQFDLQPGSPSYTSDERNSETECPHLGIGGKVYDSGGAPIVGLAIRLVGQLAGVPIGPVDTLTGSAADRFGFGGYYFEISDTPTASDNTISVQVLDASSGLPFSDQVFVDTFATCNQNLIFVHWKQVGS